MGLKRAERDLVGLTVLALLSVRPSHPYELHRYILDTHKDFVTGLPRSLYHAVDRLSRDELIAAAEITREGHRPERTVYEITGEGRAELSSRLRRLLEQPDPDLRIFSAAVSLAGCLRPEEVERSLRTRAATLQGLLVSADSHLTALGRSGLPRLLMLEIELERSVRAAELDWVRGVLNDLGSHALTWSCSQKTELLDTVAPGLETGTEPAPGRDRGETEMRIDDEEDSSG
jgi:DNA-binding PadR family transcriptional regulator